MNYLLGSGYFYGKVPAAKNGCGRQNQHDFVPIWLANLSRFTPSLKHKPVVVSVGGSKFPDGCYTAVRLLQLQGDAGHVFQKAYPLSGGTGTILALCWLAYCNETDLLYREQDVLCFGHWVEKMYVDLGNGDVLITKDNVMGYNGSLMLIRHRYLPQFTLDWLGQGRERELNNIAEMKLSRLIYKLPNVYKVASFGYDRERPFNMNDKVFFVHQPSNQDIELLKGNNLL